MRIRNGIFIGLLAVSIGLAAFLPSTHYTATDKEAELVKRILHFTERYHYSPKKIDDTFSEELFDLYMERLNSSERWFVASDIESLDRYRSELDDQIKAGDFTFMDQSIELIKKRWEETQGYYKDALSKPFDFTIEESLEFDPDKRDYPGNSEELKNYWYKLCKYETLTRLSSSLEDQEDTLDEELKAKSRETLEKEAREDVEKTFDRWYERLMERERSDFLNIYLNSMTNVFDPHTGYFEPIDKQNFDIQMSGKLEGIGARLMLDGDYTKVSSVVVGGPAYKQGDLKENDLIMKVAQEGEDPVDIAGMDLDDVVQLIRGKKGTKVILTVKKVDGSTAEVPIIRDVVELEDGFAKSLLLKSEGGADVGYISLPRFYDDFSDPNGRSCATDVAKEIEKLKTNGVNGIILDLRNNGGGSLRDVVRMSGFFIEEGPIVQIKDKVNPPKILRDTDDSVLWDGELIIMVNQLSASASEIIAAALQDYDRAIIVGSKSTFGKGTVQRFVDLDNLMGNYDMKPFGQIKLTIQKFYRVDGGSTQLKGVEPDIVLPDEYAFMDLGEKDQEYAMAWTNIDEVNYEQEVLNLTGEKAQLMQLSSDRIAKNDTYGKITYHAKYLKDQQEDSEYSLNLESYNEHMEKILEESDNYSSLFDKEVVSGVQNLPEDIAGMEGNEGKVERNKEWVKGVKKDLHLSECLNIMDDLLRVNAN